MKIVHLYVLSYRDDKRIHKMIPEFIDAIKEIFSYKEKLQLLETLLVLSRSDLDMSESEKQKIRKIAAEIGVSERDCENEIVNHAIVLTDKIQEQIANDPKLQTSEKEVSQLEIVTTKEYYRELFDPK